MDQIKDPNALQGNLPDLDLPSEEQAVRTQGDRPKASAWILRVVIILVVAAVGFVVFKFFFQGSDATPTQPTPAATPFKPPLDRTDTAGFKNAKPPAALDNTLPPPESTPVSPPTTSVEDLGPQNRILLLEQKLAQFIQEEKGKLDELKAQLVQLAQVDGNGNSAAIKQLSADGEALRQKIENWELQLQTKLNEQTTAITQAIARVITLEQIIEQQKKQQEKEREVKFNLPFKMLSIDLWNGKPYVAVSLDEKISLITVGDVVMGWKVVSIDFDGGKAIFVRNGKRVEQTTER